MGCLSAMIVIDNHSNFKRCAYMCFRCQLCLVGDRHHLLKEDLHVLGGGEAGGELRRVVQHQGIAPGALGFGGGGHQTVVILARAIPHHVLLGGEGGDIELPEDVSTATLLQSEGSAGVGVQSADDGAGLGVVADHGLVTRHSLKIDIMCTLTL